MKIHIMKKLKFILSFILIVQVGLIYAQCNVDAGPNKTIYCGSYVQLEGMNLTTATIYSETFESYSAGKLTTSSNPWKISTGTGQWAVGNGSGFAHGGNNALTTYDGSTYANYKNNATRIVYNSTPINASGYSNLRIQFYWKALGEYSSSVWVDYGRLVYSTDGTTWTEAAQILSDETSYQLADIDLSTLDNTSFYIGFKWYSNGSTMDAPGLTVDDISITGTRGTVAWSPSTGLSSTSAIDPFAQPLTTTKYYLTVTDGGCTKKDSVIVTVDNASNVDAGTASTICSDNSASLTGSYSDNPVNWVLHNANFNNGKDGYTDSYDNNSGNVWGRTTGYNNGSENITSGGSYFFHLQSDRTGAGSNTVTIAKLKSPAFSSVG